MRKFRDLKTRIVESVLRIRRSEQDKNMIFDQTTKNHDQVTHTDICLQELIMTKEYDTKQQQGKS